MDNLFTDTNEFDTIFPKYKTWEEIPVSQLKFKSSNTIICYTAVKIKESVNIMEKKAIPRELHAYEHIQNISKRPDEVIIAIELDTTNMLDFTNIDEYTKYLRAKLNNAKFSNNKPALIRQIQCSNTLNAMNFSTIQYIINDFTCIKGVYKIEN